MYVSCLTRSEGVLRRFFRGLIVLAIVVLLVWFFAPHVLSNAANTVLNPTSSSLAQGLAQFVPASSPTAQAKSAGDLQVQLSNLIAGSTYDITLDENSCNAITKDLGTAVADSNGNINVALTFAGSMPTDRVIVTDQRATGMF